MFKLKLLVKLTECPLSEMLVIGCGRWLQKTLLMDNSCCSPPTRASHITKDHPTKMFLPRCCWIDVTTRELFKMDTPMNEARKALQKPAWTVALAKTKESSAFC